MPRSTKSTAPAAATAKKRASKRSISKEPIYEIPLSPEAKEESPMPASGCDDSRSSSTYLSDIETSSQANTKQKKRNMKSSVSVTDPDITPKPAKVNKHEEIPVTAMPGLEAIEAVNGLYQKLKASQNLVNDLQRENRRLLESIKQHEQQVYKLEEEVNTTKEQLSDSIRQQQDQKNTDAEEKLNSVLTSIRSFKDAAQGIMPLLDVITDAADIEYDGATESLYQILKVHDQGDTV